MAVSYGGRDEIVRAARAIAHRVKDGTLPVEDITEEEFSKFLYLPDVPDPDLLIRTSDETRISNFLLWQLAYAEFWLTDVLWPDFTPMTFRQAIHDFQKRDRRFGGLTPQK